MSKHTEAQIIAALKQVEAGRRADDVARECGVSKHTIYAWKAKFGDIGRSTTLVTLPHLRLSPLQSTTVAILAPELMHQTRFAPRWQFGEAQPAILPTTR